MFDKMRLFLGLEQKSVVAVGRFYLAIRRVDVPCLQLAHDLLRLIRRIQPIRLKSDDEEPGIYRLA